MSFTGGYSPIPVYCALIIVSYNSGEYEKGVAARTVIGYGSQKYMAITPPRYKLS